MPIDFKDDCSNAVYADRDASLEWREWARQTLKPEGKVVADIGCGGGIYSRAFVELGAVEVIGVDSSAAYIERNRADQDIAAIEYIVGECRATGLESLSVDILFERALIHHLSDDERLNNLKEAYRILKPHGVIAVQDRCMDDVMSDDPRFWVRHELFELYPRLLEIEKQRRPDRQAYLDMLEYCGFENTGAVTFVEPRKQYCSFAELRNDIMFRKGKSILYELSDNELAAYTNRLEELYAEGKILEIDPWTVWTGIKLNDQLD